MKKILLADDSMSMERQLSRIITDSGEFEVVANARNGAEAIEMYRKVHPDIVCMDMNMPVMDGITALRALMAFDNNAKIVMVTSLGGVGNKYTEAIKLGAKKVISKPINPDELLAVLRGL